MSVESWWNDSDRGIPNYLERRLSQCHFVHHTPHIDWHDIEHAPPPATTVKGWRQTSRVLVRPDTFLISEQILSLRIHRLLCNPMFYFHVHSSLSLIPVLSLVKSCRALPSQSFKIRFNIILTYTPNSSMFQGFQAKICIRFSPYVFLICVVYTFLTGEF